jgi:hypothetical protein
VQELLDDLVHNPSPIIRRHALAALCLASDSLDEVHYRASQATHKLYDGNYKPGDLFNGMACLSLLCGYQEGEDLLREAEGRGYALANLHFTLAMMKLADKDRQGALDHLKKCAETHTIGSIDHELGRAYLIRMQADETWPYCLNDQESE